MVDFASKVPPTQKPEAHMPRPNKEFTAGVRTERAAIRRLIRKKMNQTMSNTSCFARDIYRILLADIDTHVKLTELRKGGEGRR